MLGALIILIQFLLYGYCWKVNTKIYSSYKNKELIPQTTFGLSCFINYLVFVPITCLLLTLLSLICIPTKLMDREEFLVILILIASVIVLMIEAYLYKKYKPYIASSNTAKEIISNSSKKIQQVKATLLHPNTMSKEESFVSFVKERRASVRLVTHTNSITGKQFTTCDVMDKEGKTISIRFHSTLGELTSQQLKERKDGLYIGKTNTGNYYIYDKNYKEWEDVDLDI